MGLTKNPTQAVPFTLKQMPTERQRFVCHVSAFSCRPFLQAASDHHCHCQHSLPFKVRAMASAARVYVGGLRPDVSERELEDEVSAVQM